MKKFLATCFTLILLNTHQAVAWDTSDYTSDELSRYISDLRLNKKTVFATDCSVNEHLKAVLVFQVGVETGDIFMVYDKVQRLGALSTSQAHVRFKDGVASVFDAKASTMKYMPDFARYLSAIPFRVITPDHLDDIYKKPPHYSC